MSKLQKNTEEIFSELGIPEEVLKDTMPRIVLKMLRDDLIDLKKANNRHYLLKTVKDNIRTIVPGLEQMVEIHQDFLEVAEYSIEKEKYLSAIVLITSAIEHVINMFFREILAYRGLMEAQITEAIKTTNMNAKLGWLLALTTDLKIPNELLKTIREIIELRNGIIHYKAIPDKIDVSDGTWKMIYDRLEELDFDKILNCPNELDIILMDELERVDPLRKKALYLCDVMFSNIFNGS